MSNPTKRPNRDDVSGEQSQVTQRVHGELTWVSDLNPSRKTIRSHVAKNTHAKVRRKRIFDYQQTKNWHGEQNDRNPSSTQLETQQQPRGREQELTIYHPPNRDLVSDYITDHWIPTTIPGNIFGLLAAPVSHFEYTLVGHCALNPCHKYRQSALHDWLPVAIGDRGMRMALFLCACRSLHAHTGVESYYRHALRYKAVCLSILTEAIKDLLGTGEEPHSTSVVKDTTLSTVMQLASDEFVAGDADACRSHFRALNQMIRLKGGMDTIQGMNGFLRWMVKVLPEKYQCQTEGIAIEQ
ncbi:hypothetical protein M426DRAFT_19018 [Hypoxylon sp. CI-4A]|nr:hypothetical protein M426DRAFT_19018 [Hypoxylon sp. CI-4A]